jgi:hypothetical protein
VAPLPDTPGMAAPREALEVPARVPPFTAVVPGIAA